jgi:hypothetical protein
MAQAVSRRLPTAAGWVRAQVQSCGICGIKSGTGFSCQSFHKLLHAHLLSSGTSTIGPIVSDVPRGPPSPDLKGSDWGGRPGASTKQK